MKFKDLYETFDAGCSFAAALVTMILGLNPKAEFKFYHKDGVEIVNYLKTHRKQKIGIHNNPSLYQMTTSNTDTDPQPSSSQSMPATTLTYRSQP